VANLAGADLTGASLSRAILIRTSLEDSKLGGCDVYGTSAWDVRLTEASQVGLRINAPDESEITVDDLEAAQFGYLLLSNARLRNVIETVTSKVVLVLGRFTPERKAVLDALHAQVRRRGYLPILFALDKPSRRNTAETVLTLSGIARVVIADLTDAAGVQEPSTIAFSPLTNVPA
jgi:hypothetical protein